MGVQCCNLTKQSHTWFGCLFRVSLLSILNLNTQQHWSYVRASFTTLRTLDIFRWNALRSHLCVATTNFCCLDCPCEAIFPCSWQWVTLHPPPIWRRPPQPLLLRTRAESTVQYKQNKPKINKNIYIILVTSLSLHFAIFINWNLCSFIWKYLMILHIQSSYIIFFATLMHEDKTLCVHCQFIYLSMFEIYPFLFHNIGTSSLVNWCPYFWRQQFVVLFINSSAMLSSFSLSNACQHKYSNVFK